MSYILRDFPDSRAMFGLVMEWPFISPCMTCWFLTQSVSALFRCALGPIWHAGIWGIWWLGCLFFLDVLVNGNLIPWSANPQFGMLIFIKFQIQPIKKIISCRPLFWNRLDPCLSVLWEFLWFLPVVVAFGFESQAMETSSFQPLVLDT